MERRKQALSLIGVGCSAASVLVFEITLTRVFTLTQFYHFAFLTVSLGLLGFAASGSAFGAVPVIVIAAVLAFAADKFTGNVTIEQIAKGEPPSQMSVISVHFHPGARTAWHSHSAGQTLHCTDGEGTSCGPGERTA